MKRHIILLFAAISMMGMLHAQTMREGLLEISVRTDLERLLSHSLNADQFMVRVSGVYRAENEKKLFETELIQKQDARESTSPPADLPGFEVFDSAAREFAPAELKKEKFHYAETSRLTKLNVQLFYDHALPSETVALMKDAVQSYLANQVEAKYAISFSPFVPKVVDESEPEIAEPQIPLERYILFGLLSLLALALLVWIVWLLTRRKQTEPPHFMSPESAQAFESAANSLEQKAIITSRGNFLEKILKDPDPFRIYYAGLSPSQRGALAKELDGPAFDSISKALRLDELEKNLEGDTENLNLDYFANDFNEYIKTFNWQRSLFFGFLTQYSDEVLIALFRETSPLICAVLARFIPAHRSAAILSALSEEKRRDIIRNAKSAALLPLHEITAIENSVRNQLQNMPNAGSILTKSDLDFLRELVVESFDQEKMLADIKEVDPEKYRVLAKLSFNLDDIKTLPTYLVTKVTQELDNHTLALALLSMSPELADYVLSLIPQNRRSLIVSQRSTLGGASTQEINKARKDLADLFRKELS